MSLRRWIYLLGGLNLVAALSHSALSYGLKLIRPLGLVDGRSEYFRALVAGLPEPLGPAAVALEASPAAFLVVWCAPLVVASSTFLILLWCLARYRNELDPPAVRLLFVFAATTAVVLVPALPVLADDFWLSIAWGRMIAAGLDPYAVPISADFALHTPLEKAGYEGLMPYGPLWAVLAGGVAWICGGQTLWEAALFKGLLAAGWILTLRLVWQLLADESLRTQAVGIAIVGWLPIGVRQGVAEGHNDVYLALPLLLWLCALKKRRPVLASLSLAASVLVKFATAPLFVLDVIHHWRQARGRASGQALRVLAAAALGLGLIWIVSDLRQFSVHVVGMTELDYHFFTPREAAAVLARSTGVPAAPLRWLAVSVFPLISVVQLHRYVKNPTDDNLHRTALALLCGLMFGIGNYLWPWHIIWVLGLAALVPGFVMARWVVAVALIIPLPVLVENANPWLGHWRMYAVPSLALYVSAVAAYFALPRSWFPSETEGGRSSAGAELA